MSILAQTDEFPTATDWDEFCAWSAALLDPEPTEFDWAWDDGYQAGRYGTAITPEPEPWRFGLLRNAWEDGYEDGYRARGYARQQVAAAATEQAIDAAGGIGAYLRAEHDHGLGLIPTAMAAWIAATRDVTCDPVA